MRSCGTGPVRSLPVLAQPPSSVRIHRSARCRPGRTWPVPLRACLPVTREPPLPVRAFAAPGLAAQPCKHVCLAQHAKPKHTCATTLHVPEGQRGNMQAAAKRCPCGGGRRVYGRARQRSHPRRCSLVLARLRVATRPPCPDWLCRLPAALKHPAQHVRSCPERRHHTSWHPGPVGLLCGLPVRRRARACAPHCRRVRRRAHGRLQSQAKPGRRRSRSTALGAG